MEDMGWFLGSVKPSRLLEYETGQAILNQRERIKLKTMEARRLQYCKYAA
jgi:predicted nucleotide-binding protein (sugar kinase/HSP70/actin superfamily)